MTKQKEMPWGPDDSQAKIHAAMLACMAGVTAVEAKKPKRDKEGKQGATTTSAQDIIDAARKMMVKHGVVMRIMATDWHMQGKGFVSLSMTVHFVAGDGSYWPVCMPGGALAQNLKGTQAALTAAIKSILRHTFMISVVGEGEAEAARADIMSPELRAYHDHLQTCAELADVAAAAGHETKMALGNDELHHARSLWRQRLEDIRAVDAHDKLAFYESRAMGGAEKPDNQKARRK